MEIWASVDPKDVDEKADVLVLLNDGRWDLCCLEIWDALVLFLYCFPFKCGNIWAIYLQRSLSVIRCHWAVSDQVVLQNVRELFFGRSSYLFV
jgi:hypothetical protein